MFMIFFSAVYLALTLAYLYSETSGNFKLRAANKIILSLMFLGYAAAKGLQAGSLGGIQGICLAGLCFAFLGDVLLLWDFFKGGVSFSLSNVLIFHYFHRYLDSKGLCFSDYAYFLIPLLLLTGLFVFFAFGSFLPKLEGKAAYAICAYIFSVNLHGSLGLITLFLLSDAKSLLLSFGCILFMISDYFIMFHKFGREERKSVLRLNSFTYFIGLLLIAFSFAY